MLLKDSYANMNHYVIGTLNLKYMNITVQNNIYFKLLNIKKYLQKKSINHSNTAQKFSNLNGLQQKSIFRVFFQLRPAVKNENLHQTSDRWE